MEHQGMNAANSRTLDTNSSFNSIFYEHIDLKCIVTFTSVFSDYSAKGLKYILPRLSLKSSSIQID